MSDTIDYGTGKDLLRILRSDAVIFYEYGADGGKLLRDAANEIAYEEERAYYNAQAAMRLQAENEKLREALKPFAEVDDRDDVFYILPAAFAAARSALGGAS